MGCIENTTDEEAGWMQITRKWVGGGWGGPLSHSGDVRGFVVNLGAEKNSRIKQKGKNFIK